MSAPGPDTFPTFPSVRAAEQFRDDLVDQIRAIEFQLGATDRRDGETGARMEREVYIAWRTNAKYALNAKMSQLRRVKAVLRTLRETRLNEKLDVDPENPDTMIRASLVILKRLQSEVELDPEEVDVIVACENYLDRGGRAA